MLRRAGRALLVVLLASGGLGLAVPSSTSAGCVGPRIGVGPRLSEHVPTHVATGGHQPPVLRAGDEVTVAGIWFFDGCNDTTASTGCSAPEDPPPPDPARAVELLLVQGDRTWVLGRADASGAGDRFRTRWDVTVPGDIGTGPAVLRARTAEAPVSVLG